MASEATRVLRQMSAYTSLPIVYLSGESDIGMQVEALRLGGDQFLIKPFNRCCWLRSSRPKSSVSAKPSARPGLTA